MIYFSEVQVDRPPFLGGGQWSLSKLKDITVIVGKNGSGKSLLLRAWRDLKPAEVHYILPERTGELDFQPQFMTDEQSGSTRRGQSVRNFNPDYRRRILGRLQTLFMKRGNVRQGVAPGSPTDIEQLLSVLLPDFSISLVGAGHPPYEIRRLMDEAAVGHVDQLSSGEVQLITMGLDALTIASIWEIEGPATRVILIDEPDAHIHPDLQARFADLVVRMVERYKLQVVIATHSMSLLTALTQFGTSQAATVFLNKGKGAYSAETPSEVTREIAACLGGHVLMGPLFGSPLLLVEGDDDYRIWGQVPRHHVVTAAIIPCSGSEEVKRYQSKLEQIFAALRDSHDAPVGFALLDRDKALPQMHPHNKQEHVRFIRLCCREAENLYLTDEVLETLGHTWESAFEVLVELEQIIPADKVAALANVRVDRRYGDLKGLMNHIAHALDAKNVPWTIRVSSAIGKAKPVGSLMEYLGSDLLSALWPPKP